MSTRLVWYSNGQSIVLNKWSVISMVIWILDYFSLLFKWWSICPPFSCQVISWNLVSQKQMIWILDFLKSALQMFLLFRCWIFSPPLYLFSRSYHRQLAPVFLSRHAHLSLPFLDSILHWGPHFKLDSMLPLSRELSYSFVCCEKKKVTFIIWTSDPWYCV